MLVSQQFEIFVQPPLKQVNVSEEANCWAAAPTHCCCNGDEGTLPGCERLQGNVTACFSEKWKTMTSSSPKRNLLPSGDGKSTGTPKYRCPCWRNAQGGVFIGVAHHCPKFHCTQCCLFPSVPWPSESRICSIFLSLSESWNSYRRDGECFCPRTAPQPKNWALFSLL